MFGWGSFLGVVATTLISLLVDLIFSCDSNTFTERENDFSVKLLKLYTVQNLQKFHFESN